MSQLPLPMGLPILIAVSLAPEVFADTLAAPDQSTPPVSSDQTTLEPATASTDATTRIVVVTANRLEERLSELAGSVSVVPAAEVTRRGATELYDSLNRSSGVSVSGGAGRPQNIQIRGMSGNRILIIKDGVPMPNGFGATDLNDKIGVNAFDTAAVKQIQVVKGAGSTSFGSGALGGALVLSSLTADDLLDGQRFYSDVSSNYTGISDKARFGARVASRHGNASQLLTVAYWDGNQTRNHTEDRLARTMDGFSAEWGVDYTLNDEWRLKAKVDRYEEKVFTLDGVAPIQHDGVWGAREYVEVDQNATQTLWLGVEGEPTWHGLNHIESKLYWRQSEFDERQNVLLAKTVRDIDQLRRVVDQRGFSDDVLGWSWSAEAGLAWGDVTHTAVFGGQVDSAYHDRPVLKTSSDWHGRQTEASQPFAAAQGLSVGLYWQDSMAWDQWTAMIGLRFDGHRLSADDDGLKTDAELSEDAFSSNTSSEWSPSASLAYQWTPDLNVYLSYKHGYRAPSYDKVYGNIKHDFIPIQPFEIVPNTELGPETSDAVEIGTKYDNGAVRSYFAVFYNRFKDFIDHRLTGNIDPQTGLFERQFRNTDTAETYGAEWSATYEWNRHWLMEMGVSWVSGKNGEGDYLRTIAPLAGHLNVNYERGNWSGFMGLNWADGMDRLPQCQRNRVPEACASASGWITLDIGMGYEVSDRWTINVNLFNAFDRAYTPYQNVAGIAESSIQNATNPGRYLSANLRYQF